MSDNMYLVVGMVLAGIVLVSLVSIIGGFMHCRRERLLTHAERMKALELGRPIPDDAATAQLKATLGISSGAEGTGTGSHARKCFSTALWVAFWGFIAAASHEGVGVSTGVAYAIAASTGAIGVTAMICGTVLAAQSARPTAQHRASFKPATEEDAFDVVSCRG